MEFTPEPTPLATDPVPELDTMPDYACLVCGKELTYGGRGRKPRYCEDHKGGKTSSTPSTARKGSPKNLTLAADAANALCNMHSMGAVGAQVLGFSQTKDAIIEANDPFYEAAKAALASDPALCRRILSSGAGTGTVALVVAYAMFVGAIIPTAVNESREKRDAKAAQLLADELAAGL